MAGKTTYSFISFCLLTFFSCVKWTIVYLLVLSFQASAAVTSENPALSKADGHAGCYLLLFLAAMMAVGLAGLIIWNMHLSRDNRRRKEAFSALEDERWRLNSIIEGTRVGTWEWNFQTSEVKVNEQFAQIIGYTLAEISPLTTAVWQTYAHPDDFEKSVELLKKHFAGEIPYYECECRMKHKNGEWIYVLDRGKIINRTPDGKPLMVFGTHADITESKRQNDIVEKQRDQLALKKIELEEMLARVKQLEGIIPICMYCKKIRCTDSSWQAIETYISEHSDALFSHGICPICTKKHFPNYRG